MSTLGPHHQPYTQGSEALSEWEAWNDMVTSHLEKQHNPTLHSVVRRSSSTSVMSDRGGDHHGASETMLGAPHWLVQTESSSKKAHREVFSTPRSRAELFLAANSPPGVDTASVVDSASSSFSIERRRSNRSMMPPSASESLPHNPPPFNYLVASASRKDIMLRTGQETADIAVEEPSVVRMGEVTHGSTPGDASPASSTPRSARLDAQRILRLRQEREERNRVAAMRQCLLPNEAQSSADGTDAAGCVPDDDSSTTHEQQRMPTLDDIARGVLDKDAIAIEHNLPTVTVTGPATDRHKAAEAGTEPRGDHCGPSEEAPTALPAVVPVIEEETILSSPDASSASSDDIAPNSSEDVEAHVTAAVPNELPSGVSGPTSKKRAAVDQLPYRKKKELIEKARSRHLAQDEAASVTPAAVLRSGGECNDSSPSNERPVASRRDAARADGQTSNADADVSRGDDDAPHATVKRSQREKKSSSGSRRRVSQTSNSRDVPQAVADPCAPPPLPGVPPAAALPPTTSEQATMVHSCTPELTSFEQEACESFSVPAHESQSIGEPNFSPLAAMAASNRRSIEHAPRPVRRSFEAGSSDNDADTTTTVTTCSSSDNESNVEVTQRDIESGSDDLDAAVLKAIQERASLPQPSIDSDTAVDPSAAPLFCCSAKEQLSSALSERDMTADALSSTQAELQTTREMLRSAEAANHRLEQQQSLLLSALDRCALAAEVAEEEDEVRRALAVAEQSMWDVAIEAGSIEDQTCLEAVRYDHIVDEGHCSKEATWLETCADLNSRISDLERRLSAAYEEHEEDVAEREMEFERERSDLALMHVEAIDALTTRHADALAATQAHLWGLVESTKADLTASLAAAHAQHEETTTTFQAAHLAALAAADSQRQLQVQSTQRCGAHLADRLWRQLHESDTTLGALRVFHEWKHAAMQQRHHKERQQQAAQHGAAVAQIQSDHERVVSDATDEYSKLQQQNQFVLSMADALQSNLDAATATLSQLSNEHEALRDYCARLERENEAHVLEKQRRDQYVATLEALLHKTKAIFDAQRKELFAQASSLQSQTLLTLQAERCAARLCHQRQALQGQVCALMGHERLAVWWQRWHRRVVERMIREGQAAHKQNDEAREELRRWREHLLSANSPRRSRGGGVQVESQSSRTGSRGAQSANMSTSFRAGSAVSSFGPNHRTTSVASGGTTIEGGAATLLDAEDDLTISLKYLLARERGELTAVKASLVKHRQMLGEGNEAMERMIMEMEILSKQNKELVKLCSKRGLDVPRALKSAEVPRIVQRMFVEEGAAPGACESPPPHPPAAVKPSPGPMPAHRFTRAEEDADDGYVVD